MNYGGNMPDWHQYNSTQPIGSEVPPVGQNANHSPIFGSNISSRRLNGPTFSPEGLNKPQNEANFNPRNFQPSPNTLNGPNIPPENSPMGSAAQMSGCHGPYRALSPRNTIIEGTATSLDSRSIPSNSLNEAIDQRNHQISMNRPAAHLNCSSMNGSMGPMGQRNTPTSVQAPIPTSSRQGPGPYVPCKLACCNPDTNISYQSWEKFGPYPPNAPYRETNYPVDNRRFGNDFENREQLSAGAYNMDSRRNFPDYKYQKDTIIPRPYAPPPSVIQNYPIQNYNFPADYQKYPAYPVKEYPRETSIPNPQNPGILKYQEQSVIVQQKYFTKQIQYQNGVIPKSMGPTSMTSNVISRAQNPYFNPQLTRDFPQSYSERSSLGNRGIQTTNPIHTAYPKYQMYQQKIAMQRFSMENHLRELTRIPGYQTHPKYQESVLRYRELLRLQQTVNYQSTVQDQPNIATSLVNDEIPPINLQFDQNGVLINSSFAPSGFSNLQGPINLQNSKNVQRVNNTEPRTLNLQYSEQFKTQANIDKRIQDQDSSPLSQTELPCKNEQHYSVEKDQLRGEKYESESPQIRNSDDGKTASMHQRNSRDFADKPELDVRQFLANWDESEDEDGTNANLPDVVLSNSTSGVVTEYENTNAVSDNPEESKNCSETEDCHGGNECGIFENTQNETKPNSTDNKNYQSDLPQASERIKSPEEDLDISGSGKEVIRTGTVIQPTSAECNNEISLHIMENVANSRPAQDSVKLLPRETESLNNNESQELSGPIKDDIIVKKESIEEETITSIKEHIKAYNHEADTDLCSNIEEIIENDEDSRSSYGKESSVSTKHHYDSGDDLSESCNSDSMDSHSISSYMKSPKTIKGTEIHVDAQELSANPVPPKSNSETVDTTNLQKQNSFASEELHNPDDISLPDLPTSECTPISTTLNTPIHSDSEESSEPVIDLTTPANPIEIIQNSPMLSFTHSPIKMEPYEHLDENDVTDRVSHDALDFEFQTSNSCDNDYDKLTDVSSHGIEPCSMPQNEEDSFDSECSAILSEKSEREIEFNTGEEETKNDVTDNITDRNRFAFHKENVMTTGKTNTILNADHQPWSSVTVSEYKHQISSNTEHQGAASDLDKLETLSEMKDRLSAMSEVAEDHSEDDSSSAKSDHSISKRQTKCEIEDVESESTDNMTALNLVKEESKIKSDPMKMTDETANTEVVPKASNSCPSNTNEGIKHPKPSECNSSMESEELFTSAERTVEYKSSSGENKIYAENVESQSNFTGSLNIPLIPGEDFEEPKMPVLPMEGNCLTKIIKNTSPITDLDVLGSDDEKLDKMDEIWSEVGGVETVDKVADVNIDIYTGRGDGSDREKSSSSKNKSRVAQKYDWKCLKNSVKPKDPNKLLGKVYNSQEMDLKASVGNDWHLHKYSSLETTRKESEPVNEDFQSAIISGTDNTAIISQEKRNFIKISSISRVVTSNNSSREESKQSHDTCLENNATEVLKCKEKANHINDIATKLLENARLFEPELRKTEIQRRESSCSENSRDGSKKRIKLLKEFRKGKDKMNTNGPENQLIKPAEPVKSNVVSSIEITEQSKKEDVEPIKVNNEIIRKQNALTDTIESVLQKSDPLITFSMNALGCQVIQKINVNAGESTSVSTDISMPDEKLNDSEATLENEQTPGKSCSIVNPKDYITVEDSNNINGHNSIDSKAAGTIEEEINECAINLSKSSKNFGSLETLNEKSCVKNDNHDSYTSDIEIESVEIESKSNETTTYMETKDDSPLLSQSLCPEDSGLYAEVQEGDEFMEINHVHPENVKEDNPEVGSATTGKDSVKECILKEDTKEEIDPESTKTADHGESEDLLSNTEKMGDVTTSCSHPEEIISSIDGNCLNTTAQVFETTDAQMHPLVSKQDKHSKSIASVTVEDEEDQKPADKTVDCEITCNADDNVWNDEDAPSKETKEESLQLIDSFDESGEQPSPNDSAEQGTSIKSIDNSLQKTSNVSEEEVLEPMETKIETTSLIDQKRNTFELPDTQQLLELESIVDDCQIRIQKNLQDLHTTDIATESKTIPNDPQIIETPSVRDELIMKNQLEECAKIDCLQNTDLAVVPPTDRNSSTIDATLEAFALENSFNGDFSNFDVAPNFIDTADAADADQSNNWKYSKAYARFEDCERYKNPDNFVNPILTSLDTLDNLNTVPVYTTKDGKITYSPNPRFTYRALIMEAREREGYPTLRESYYGNSRNQESFKYSKNQASFRKRKSSDAYSYSGSYGKKNYLEHYEPREHGESSTKNSPEPRNRNYYFNHNKYSHQSRDRNSRHFTPHNSDAERKYTAEKISQEKASAKYKDREVCKVFSELNKRKNGTSDSVKGNNSKQYKQSIDQSASNSAWSGSKRNFKCDQDSSKITSTRSETTKLTNNEKKCNYDTTISTEKCINNFKNGSRSTGFEQPEKFTSISDGNKCASNSSANISELNISSDILQMANKIPEFKVQSLEPSLRVTDNISLNVPNLLPIPSHEANEASILKSKSFFSEWEDSCEELPLQRSSSCQMKIPTESLLEEIQNVCDKQTKVNELYDGVDDIHQSKMSDINEKDSDNTDLSGNKWDIPPNSVQSPVRNEKVTDSDCNQEKLNVDRYESTINNAENKDPSCSMPIKLVQSNKDADEQKISETPEIQDKSEPANNLNEEAECIQEEGKFDEPLHCTNGQLNFNYTENCASEVKDVDHEEVVKDAIRLDKKIKSESLNQIDEVQHNLAARNPEAQISRSSENLCNVEEIDESERKEPPIKCYKIKPDNKNETSVKNLEQASSDDLSHTVVSEYENATKPQSQCENYVAYSPSDDSPEAMKAIPKLVIKKTDSLGCKNVCLGPLAVTSQDAFVEKVPDKEECGSKVSVHPKIPKILIRNAKSRPSTPSIEEITEEECFSVTTKEENKVPKVKIRFEEKRSRSPTVSSSENVLKTDVMETKIPKMKIKLEDRLPKVIIENINKEMCGPNEELQKTIPKMKIKKCGGTLRQIVDTQILPVSIPRMLICTELESEKETTQKILIKKETCTSDKNSKSIAPTSIPEDQKSGKDSDVKKIPKLKIKRQSSGCSIEMNRKRHSVSPIQSELKKTKKSLKLAETNDKKQSNKLSMGLDHDNTMKKFDVFSIEPSYELASSENIKYTAAAQSTDSVRGEQTKSAGGNTSGTPEEIPKVIIKRASPSAEFKCELSKVRRDAIIKNKRWQPEVKLQRSWVLDCMAKDLNLDKLRLKVATPDSILKKSLLQKEPEVKATHMKNGKVNINRNDKKLFRSKSTSELLPAHGSIGIVAKNDVKELDERNATGLPRELITPKRCKSDLGGMFSECSENFACKKKLRHKNHSSTIQVTSKPTFNNANEVVNSLNIQSVKEEADIVEYGAVMDVTTNLSFKERQSCNEAVHLMEPSERSQPENLAKNMNVEKDDFMTKINSVLPNNSTSALLDSDLTLEVFSGSTNTTNTSKSEYECHGNSNEITKIFTNNLKIDGADKVNESYSDYSTVECTDRFEVSKGSIVIENTNVDSVKRHTKSGKKHAKEIRNTSTKEEKTLEIESNETSFIKNMSTDYIDSEKTSRISSTSAASHEKIDQSEINTEVPAEPFTRQVLISEKSDINILENDSEIYSPGVIYTVDDIQTLNPKSTVHKVDINDNSDDNIKERGDQDVISENAISHANIVDQENISTLNGKVLTTSDMNNSKSTYSDSSDVQDPKIDINRNNSLENLRESDGNSLKKSSEEKEAIIQILSASPGLSQSEVEIQLCPDVIEEHGICLYHEDAIPTQFELELEIIDHTVPDPLEVPMPHNDHPIEECRTYSGDELSEDSHQLSRILNDSEDSINLDDSESAAMLPEENSSQVSSISTYQREVFAHPDKEDIILSTDVDEQKTNSNVRPKTTKEFDSNIEKSFSSTDLLVKEVLAAKEKLRKCLGKSKNEIRFKVKARPKTAAEKKQGLSFDLNTIASCEDSFTKSETHSWTNFIAEANSSKQMDQNLSKADDNEKFYQNRTKTEFKINKIKSERKHSKGSKNDVLQRKYSNLPKNVEKYTNLTQGGGYLIPNNSSIDIKDRVEFSKGETTISLKNSKYLIKNHSYSDARKKTPELINSKDSKCRSKSSRQDVNSKYVGKSKSSALPNAVVQESSLDFGQSAEAPISDAAKDNKYKSLKTSMYQNVNSTTEKTKFKLYKIPKIIKPIHPRNERLTEGLRESLTKEARMPILEPQVDLNGGLEVLDLSSDRESSRSPPVITNQEGGTEYEATTDSLESQVSLNKEKQALSRQKTTILQNKISEAKSSFGKEITVADIVNDMAYHEKATIRHRRYCTLCERWFPTVARYRRHLSGYQHRHTELTQRRTIHALFTLFTGRPCPRLQPPGEVRIDCEPGELTPLQIAVQGVTKESNKVDGNIKKPTREDK